MMRSARAYPGMPSSSRTWIMPGATDKSTSTPAAQAFGKDDAVWMEDVARAGEQQRPRQNGKVSIDGAYAPVRAFDPGREQTDRLQPAWDCQPRIAPGERVNVRIGKRHVEAG